MKIAAIQLDVETGALEQNRRRAAALLRQAAAGGAKLALLPELWPSGFALENLSKTAENLREGSVNLLRQLARDLDLFIVGGSLAEKRDGRHYNTCVAVGRDGEIEAKYRKTHLAPQGVCEDKYFSRGDEWTLCQCGDLSIGLLICYDIFFPEFARNLCLRGAQLLTVPAWADTAKDIERFHILAKARALENNCFVAIANCAAEQGVAGHSLIVSPRGQVLAEAGEEAGVLFAELDVDALNQHQERHQYLNDRRNILDEIDNNQL